MPATRIACLGLSHRTAPVALRERLSCSLADVHRLLPLMARVQEANGRHDCLAAVQEVVILSTCNRMEIYASLEAGGVSPRVTLTNLLAAVHHTDLAPFADQLYFFQGWNAVDHLCHVASGLDSLVLGEPQILGQVTEAYMAAVDEGTAGPVLTATFQAAIRAGKRARTETEISSQPTSISSVAIGHAQAITGDLAEQQVLVVGLGEMARLALKALRARGVARVAVANRTKAKAATAVAPWGGAAYGLDELPTALAKADVVISATGSPTPVIDKAMVAQARARRADRPLVLIDIAVPRDVDPGAAGLPGVHLFDVDDLQDTLNEALVARQTQVPRVQAIIAEEIETLDKELRELLVQPIIVDLRRKAEVIRQRELERTLRYLRDIDPQTLDHIHHLSRSLVNKLLHEPTMRLKAHASDSDTAEFAAAVRDLFGLEDPPE